MRDRPTVDGIRMVGRRRTLSVEGVGRRHLVGYLPDARQQIVSHTSTAVDYLYFRKAKQQTQIFDGQPRAASSWLCTRQHESPLSKFAFVERVSC